MTQILSENVKQTGGFIQFISEPNITGEFDFYGFDIKLQQLLSDDEFTHYVWTFCTFIDAKYHFLELKLIFRTVRVSAFAAGVREQLVTRARNLARELQPSLLAKDVSPERKPLRAARRDGCIRRPVGIFICYLVTVSM